MTGCRRAYGSPGVENYSINDISLKSELMTSIQSVSNLIRNVGSPAGNPSVSDQTPVQSAIPTLINCRQTEHYRLVKSSEVVWIANKIKATRQILNGDC